MSLVLLINIITAALFAGAMAWGLLWLLSRAAPKLRFKGAFPELVQSISGAAARRELRAVERDLLILGAGAVAALTGGALLWVYGTARLEGVWMWVLFGLACALFVAWWVFLVRKSLAWRECRYAARAHAALGGTLARLAVQGHRVFHDVPAGELILDHVVMGNRGVFAIRVVARRPRKGDSHVVRINGRSIEFQDGFALLDTIALAERSARALADVQVKGLSHRLHVLPVVAVPGWEIAPAQGQAGETFLINEKTAVLLLRSSKPADYLMEADTGLLHEHLAKICLDTTF
ncbi:MAG TPA: hypothetical protein VHP13_10640 [Gammaproteobacteria bacterium]|jgi:hypothetical protein|nr:hypothetical protein [Gammaproteobacteria bacterium]